MKVEFAIRQINGQPGLVLVRLDESATVADLLAALQPFSDDPAIHKQYLPAGCGTCRACPVNCCRASYVIPDKISFLKLVDHLGVTPADFFDRFIDLERRKFGLPRLLSRPCIFLQNDICSVYPCRTLICQLYFCTPMEGDTEELIYSVVCAGIAELVRWAREAGWLTAQPDGVPPSGYDRLFMDLIKQWLDKPDNPFQGAESYSEVKLAGVCPPQIWRRLTQI